MSNRLVFVLLACPFAMAAASGDPPPVPTVPQLETLQRAVAEAITAKDWTRALVVAERVNDVVEEQHVETPYTIARLQALLGHKKEAYEWLQRVADAGLMNVWEVRRDEAFAGIRDEDQFKKLTRAIWLKAYIHLLLRKERDTYQKPE